MFFCLFVRGSKHSEGEGEGLLGFMGKVLSMSCNFVFCILYWYL